METQVSDQPEIVKTDHETNPDVIIHTVIVGEEEKDDVHVTDVRVVNVAETDVVNVENQEVDTKESMENKGVIPVIIGEDEDGEAIDMADIRVLDDMDTENRSPVKMDPVPVVVVKVEDDEEPPVKKKKSYEFFYPDMVSTLELALLGLPSMANHQRSKADIKPPPGLQQLVDIKPPPGIQPRGASQKATGQEDMEQDVVERRITRNSTRNVAKKVEPAVLVDKRQVPETKQLKSSPKVVVKRPKVSPRAVVTPTMPKTVSPRAIITPTIPKTVAKQTMIMETVTILPQIKPRVGERMPAGILKPKTTHMAVNYSPNPSKTTPASMIRPLVPRVREWRKKGRSTRSRGATGLIVDKQKEIPTVMMKMRVSDTSDIVTSLDLAPPTKKLMQLKEAEGRDTIRLFTLPGRSLTPRLAWPLYYPNLLTSHKDDDDDGDDMCEEAEEGQPEDQKKCFTIIRSEPMNTAGDEEHIQYTNQLSDEDDDGAQVTTTYVTEIPYIPEPVDFPGHIKVESTEDVTADNVTPCPVPGSMTFSKPDNLNVNTVVAASNQSGIVVLAEAGHGIPNIIQVFETTPVSQEGMVTVETAGEECVTSDHMGDCVHDNSGLHHVVITVNEDVPGLGRALTSVSGNISGEGQVVDEIVQIVNENASVVSQAINPVSKNVSGSGQAVYTVVENISGVGQSVITVSEGVQEVSSGSENVPAVGQAVTGDGQDPSGAAASSGELVQIKDEQEDGCIIVSVVTEPSDLQVEIESIANAPVSETS